MIPTDVMFIKSAGQEDEKRPLTTTAACSFIRYVAVEYLSSTVKEIYVVGAGSQGSSSLVQLQSTCWRVGKKWEISPSSPTLFQLFRPSTQLIQTRWSKACTPPLPSWQLSSQYPSSGCLLMWDWQETKKQTRLAKIGSQAPQTQNPHSHLQRGQDTSPLSV